MLDGKRYYADFPDEDRELRPRMSTPEQKCISWPEQKYISDAGNKVPELGPFLEALRLGGIVHRHFRAGTA